jgi:twitching motility protein PilT
VPTHAMLTHPIGVGIDALLSVLWEAHGTDLLLTAGMAPQIRVQGELSGVPDHPVLTPSGVEALLADLLDEEQSVAWLDQYEFDFAFSWKETARVRGNAYTQRGSTAVALRIIPLKIPTMAELGLPPAMEAFIRQPQGLVLVTGPTGSGKSTTLASMIHQISIDRACHIITIEDPIEYLHPHSRSAVDQREVGSDTASFADGLRSVLREDPDVLLVGEMRDLASIRFALTIAETGHLVFATMHTNDTAQALARIIGVFPSDEQPQVRVQLAAALSGIAYQQLIPRIGGGMVAAHEVLVANGAVRNMISDGKTNQLRNALVTGHKDGMVTFEKSLSRLVASGQVTYQDAVECSLFPKDIEQQPRLRTKVSA